MKPPHRTLRMVVTGLVTGVFSGLTGVGGGAVLVPLLTDLVGMGQHRAHGSSMAILAVTAAAGAITYLQAGYVDVGLSLQIAAGSVVGVVLGARVMTRLPASVLRRLFGLFLLGIGIRMFFL
ncbi:MAG: sulfite exporter TauE/SafE family protein [Chloroflexi bacterium]|nr:sulfite exporter TauE/SafE family protein [Chloroflexota bacterium]